MSNPTTPFGWQMPTNTDLVTDLPADFEVFGQAVATSMADLLGGTTGQILAKNTNADMDFVWITNDVGDITEVAAGTGISGGGTSGAVTITNTMATAITTSGDLIQGTGSGTFARLGSGTSGQFLSTNGTTLNWASAPTSQMNWSLIGGPTSMAGSATITFSGITDADKLLLIFNGASSGGASAYKVKCLINNLTTSIYRPGGILHQAPTAYSQNIMDQYNEGTTQTSIYLGQFASSAASFMSGAVYIYGGATAGQKVWQAQVGTTPASSNNAQGSNSAGAVNTTATISSIRINHDDGNTNFDDGYVWLYKSA